MSLRAFHIVFVTFSTLLSFAFGSWAMNFYRATRSSAYLMTGVASFAFGVGLIAYGFWFWRKIRSHEGDDKKRRKVIHTVPVLCLIWLLNSRAAEACTVCYGEAEGPMIDAARWGVYLLFGLVLAVQIAFGAFFVQLWRRSRLAQTNNLNL